jgi:hypothetical protein
MGFSFIVQYSDDRSGLHGETFYVVLRDHFSNTLYGAALRSEAYPIK